MKDEEGALITRFLEGEELAFRMLYQLHTPVLFRMAHRSLGGREDEACDAVQEVWLRAARGLARFRGESSFRTWLLGILINYCREQTRSRSRTSLTADDPPETESANPNPAWASRLDLEEAVRQLPAGCREVLLLHDVEGYTHQEIAGILSIEPGTSKSQLFRARRALRSMLAGPGTATGMEKNDVRS